MVTGIIAEFRMECQCDTISPTNTDDFARKSTFYLVSNLAESRCSDEDARESTI